MTKNSIGLSARHQTLESDMAANPDPATYGKLAAEYSELGPVVAKIGQLRERRKVARRRRRIA